MRKLLWSNKIHTIGILSRKIRLLSPSVFSLLGAPSDDRRFLEGLLGGKDSETEGSEDRLLPLNDVKVELLLLWAWFG